MTTTPLSTIELETGFLRRDGNPVAADEIERAARELAGPTTMTDVDTSTATIMSRAEKWDKHMEKVAADAKKYADVAVAREDFGLAEIADQLRALAAERDELERLAGEANSAYWDIDQDGPDSPCVKLLAEKMLALSKYLFEVSRQRKGE